MKLTTPIEFLHRSKTAIPALVEGLSAEQFRWKPPSENWSVLEIMGHLVVEETHDFRKRVQMTLADPTQAWPDYDPEGIVAAENFNDRNPQQIIQLFVTERTASLAWLESLQAPDWERTYQHPRMGPLRAGDLMTSWVAHDQLHIRQIAKRCFEMIAAAGRPFATDYAGDWTA